MTSSNNSTNRIALAFAIALFAIAGLLLSLNINRIASAETVVGWVSIGDSVTAGTTVYTQAQTAIAGPWFSANFSRIEIQSNTDVQASSVQTVSLQFYNGPLGCTNANATYYTAEEIGYYTTETVLVALPLSVTVNSGLTQVATLRQLLHSGDGNKGRVWPIDGKCARLSIAGSDRFTPTIAGRMVNTQ